MPVVVVSASARQGRGEVAGAAFGVADWLDKPFDRVRLVEAVGAAVASCPPGRRARVLHVEDDGNLRRVIDAALRDDGVTVDGAADLREAGERLRHGRYDLVLLDLGLPDGAGLEVLRHLTATGHGSTPVVIFSASDATDEVARTVAAQLIKSRTTVDDLRAVILANLAEVRRDRANR